MEATNGHEGRDGRVLSILPHYLNIFTFPLREYTNHAHQGRYDRINKQWIEMLILLTRKNADD